MKIAVAGYNCHVLVWDWKILGRLFWWAFGLGFSLVSWTLLGQAWGMETGCSFRLFFRART